MQRVESEAAGEGSRADDNADVDAREQRPTHRERCFCFLGWGTGGDDAEWWDGSRGRGQKASWEMGLQALTLSGNPSRNILCYCSAAQCSLAVQCSAVQLGCSVWFWGQRQAPIKWGAMTDDEQPN